MTGFLPAGAVPCGDSSEVPAFGAGDASPVPTRAARGSNNANVDLSEWCLLHDLFFLPHDLAVGRARVVVELDNVEQGKDLRTDVNSIYKHNGEMEYLFLPDLCIFPTPLFGSVLAH